MITVFEELIQDEKKQKEATDHAWTIFKYFIAPDAPYEVSLHSRHKKELMISLSYPYLGMFQELKKSSMSVLIVNFNAYKFTSSYRNLWQILKYTKRSNNRLINGIIKLFVQ
jgi:hypothetical protein